MPRPTHYLAMKSRDREVKNSRRIAAVWANEGGSFSLVLDPGVTISWRDMEDCIFTIFPSEAEDQVHNNITRIGERRKHKE